LDRREYKITDPNIRRKEGLIAQHLDQKASREDGPPLFSVLEFNLIDSCNRRCLFCPRKDAQLFPNSKAKLQLGLYQKIMAELNQLGYDGLLLFSAFCEPLLHPQLEKLILTAKASCPKARVEIVTNGDLLNPGRLEALFGAGLDVLLISLYDGPDQAAKFEAMRQEAGLNQDQVLLRPRWLGPEEHFGMALSNRAGMVEIEAAGVRRLTEPLQNRCFYPFYEMMVNTDGTVLLCPHDWGKRLKMGNLISSSVIEIWQSDLMKQVRLNLARPDRGFEPCLACDVKGTLMGESHFHKWIAHYGRD